MDRNRTAPSCSNTKSSIRSTAATAKPQNRTDKTVQPEPAASQAMAALALIRAIVAHLEARNFFAGREIEELKEMAIANLPELPNQTTQETGMLRSARLLVTDVVPGITAGRS